MLTRSILIGLLALGVATAAAAQPWEILRFGDDMTELEETVSKRIEEGMLPVGIDVSNEEGILVLLVEAPQFEATDWVLYEASSPAQTTAEFTDIMRSGYLLMDVSIDEDRIVGLFAAIPAVVSGWRIVQTELQSPEALIDLSEFTDAGFVPWGISVAGDVYSHLLLRLEAGDEFDTILVGVPSEPSLLSSAVTAFIQDGWLPWGLARRDAEYVIRMIRTVERAQ